MKILIKNINLISMDDKRDKICSNTDILIENEFIKEIGKIESSADIYIDGTDKYILPGFINNHTHIPMNAFKNRIDGLDLQTWLNDYIWPIEAKFNKKTVYTFTKLACLEFIQNGITTVNDQYFLYGGIIKGMKEMEVNLVVNRAFINDGQKDIKIKEFKELYAKEKDVYFGIGIHGLYTNNPEDIKEYADIARKYNLTIHMHFCENESERKTIINRYNVNHPAEVLEKYFKGLNLILAHCVKLDDYDLKVIKENNWTIVTNPVSNLKLGCGIANYQKMKELGINLTVGTDGAGSGNNSDLLLNARLVNLLMCGISENPTCYEAIDILKMLTINAAKSLKIDNERGSIEVGKKADLVIFNFKELLCYPINDVVRNIVNNASSADIETVLINGHIVYQDNEFNFDKDKILNEFNDISKELFNE